MIIDLGSEYTFDPTGYFIMDAVCSYTKSNFSIGFMAENLLNTYWREAQFAYVSRLKDEATPVDDVSYLP